MAGTQKKVVIRPFHGAPVSGYLPASGLVDAGHVHVIDVGGRIIVIPLLEIKLIAYVRDFNTGDAVEPERLGRKSFPARPRSEGLWLRLTFLDGDVLEGMAALDISFVDSINTDQGVTFTPPDVRSNALRVYVPRSALSSLELLGVVTSAAKRKAAIRSAREPQPWLFDNN